MIVKILGFENRTTVNEDTGERKEAIQIYYSKNNKAENSFGEMTGTEFVQGKNFPEQVSTIIKAGKDIIGTLASISKDTRTFKGTTYSILDEFELLKK